MAGQSVALIIATYEYQDAGLSRLTAPASDAQALADALLSQMPSGFQVNHTGENQPSHVVGEAVGQSSQAKGMNCATFNSPATVRRNDVCRCTQAMTRHLVATGSLFTGLVRRSS